MAIFYDGYSPFVSAAIINPTTGDRFPFWTDVDADALDRAKVPDSLRSLAFMTDASVELNLGPIPILSVTLSPPHRYFRALADSELVEWGVTHLQIQFGYTGGSQGQVLLSPIYEGIILQPDVQLGEQSSITYKAQGVGGFSAIRQKSNMYFEQPRTRIEILKELAKGPDPNNPRDLEVDPGLVQKMKSSLKTIYKDNVYRGVRTEYDALFNQPINFNQGSDTDWWAISKLVRECRCTLSLIANKIVIIPMNLTMGDVPRRKLVYYDYDGRAFGPGTGILPLYSYNTSQTHMYLPGALRSIAVGDVSEKTREDVESWIGDDKAKTTRTGEGSANIPASKDFPGLNEEGFGGGDTIPGDPTDPAFLQKVMAEYDSFTQNMGIKATLETMGDPFLFPSNIVEVKGVGARFDGNYALLMVRHTFSSGGYRMEMEGVSNIGKALSAAKAKLVAPKGKTNTETTDPDAPGSVDVPAGKSNS